jgi:alkylation response protein AidB-like acyl-CoA dehydrogenase
MRFAFTEEQLALAGAVRDLLERHCPPAVVREAWNAPPGALSRGPWDGLVEMGVMEVLVPAAAGGLGLDYCSLVLLLEESGRAALPHPIVETAAVAAPLLGAGAAGAAGAAAGAGEMVGACLAGSPVACARDVDRLVVDDGGSLYLAGRDEVVVEDLPSVDGGRRLGRIAGISGTAAPLASGVVAVEAAFDRAALGAAAQLIGLSQRMLDMTVSHVGSRRQFGVAVGSFQAVKHQLADCLTELSFARPVVYSAAYAMAAQLPERSTAVSTAKAMASEAALYVGRRALQCHGAMGYTVEYDLHLYMKRAWALARAYGDAAWHRRRVAMALGMLSPRGEVVAGKGAADAVAASRGVTA